MIEEEMKERIIRLEEQIKAAEKALILAQNNTQAITAQLISILAIIVSIYAVVHK